jgi:two-component system, sensor histidine kinase PdtaS
MKLIIWILLLFAPTLQTVKAQTQDSITLRDQNPNHLRSKLRYTKPTNSAVSDSAKIVSLDTANATVLPTQNPTVRNTEIETYIENLKEAEKKHDQAAIAKALSSLGAYSLKNNNLPAAVVYYQKELKIQETRQDKKATLETLQHIGSVYYSLKNTSEAETYYKKSLVLAKTLKYSEKIKLAGDALSVIYAAKGNYKNAYEISLLLKQVTDSLNKNEIKQKLLQTRLSYDSLQQIERTKTYQKEILQKQSEVEKSRKIVYLIIAAFVLALSLAISFYRSYKNTKKTNLTIKLQKKEAEEKNEVIEQSLKEKEILLKEIHHRVKNNLQIISSLLNLQSKRIKDEDTQKIMNEARARIASMALIHQKIYQSGNLGSVDLQTYIEQMVQSIEATFSNNKKNISYYINTHGIILDIDTSIPLGLIINELLTNIYKYAFINRDAGMIVINLEKKAGFEMELEVSDNGVGLPPDFDADKVNSLGLKLVKGLANQIKGTLRFESKNGTHCFITINKGQQI